MPAGNHGKFRIVYVPRPPKDFSHHGLNFGVGDWRICGIVNFAYSNP